MVCRDVFGQDESGETIWIFHLTNRKGMSVSIANYGATVTAIKTADRWGRMDDVVLGFENLDGYLQNPRAYFGAIVGRYANRIGGAAFSLNGQSYRLSTNEGRNSLHGGAKGFDKQIWRIVAFTNDPCELRLRYVSADGEEGYPGEMDVQVTYLLTDDNELHIDYVAQAAGDTVVNLTDHSDFNLAGAGSGDILEHRLQMASARYLAVRDGLIPTGEVRPVESSAFDFLQFRAIGDRIGEPDLQLEVANGYDHTFVLDGWDGTLRKAAAVYEPASGRVLELSTTQPGLHFYSGNFLDGSIAGKGGKKYGFRGAFYLGGQHFPDSPNQCGFPTTVLKSREVYRSTTVYRFSTVASLEEFLQRAVFRKSE